MNIICEVILHTYTKKGIPCNFTGFLENRPIHESKKLVLVLKLVKSQNCQVDHINMADSFNHTA